MLTTAPESLPAPPPDDELPLLDCELVDPLVPDPLEPELPLGAALDAPADPPVDEELALLMPREAFPAVTVEAPAFPASLSPAVPAAVADPGPEDPTAPFVHAGCAMNSSASRGIGVRRATRQLRHLRPICPGEVTRIS
ncbi:MAG: hypothetical protein ABSF69_11370 [Polyangiaceae bacterium]